ncbi:MAG: aminoglycoside phosphotransferase, partial [Hyphomicrobiales bacterium]|nr:aminoglycoside phosphotransferase [Hyphomicrobiales bacterium]
PDIPDLLSCWLEGYESVRTLRAADKDEIESFIMLRRMALLAWIGSHKETDLAKEMAPHFARVSTELAESYLARFE